MIDEHFPARYWHPIADDTIQCDLCPRDCKLHDGQRGLCFVRKNEGGKMVLTTYGRSSGFCIDPIEKKPLNHFYPGSSVLSFGTAGCNLACRYCQNWDMSKSREMDSLCDAASGESIAQAAKDSGCSSVAYTYNDPVIFLEYAIDVAKACRTFDIRNVAVTAGYVHPQARDEFFSYMDAVNVDLKSFNQDFYHKFCAGHLQPVLDTLKYLVHKTDVWTEITTLLIPGENDSDDEIKQMCDWILEELGPDVPLHLSAFHPDYKMLATPQTSPARLTRARNIALNCGLHFVYTGNVHDTNGQTTSCPKCATPLIVRDWYDILDYQIKNINQCPNCSHTISGAFTEFDQAFGNRRIPVLL